MAKKPDTKGIWYHSLIYWLGVVLSKLASFILIPVFTHYLAPADYGTLELITTTTGVLALLLGGRLTSALMRFYHTAETERDRRSVVSTALLLGSAAAGVSGVLLVLSAPLFSRLILHTDEAYLFQIVFAAMALGLVQEMALGYLRIKEKSILFVSINLFRVTAMLSLNVLFIAYFHLGVLGALLGPALVSTVLAPLLVGAVLWRTGLSIDRPLCLRLVRYSAPLVPAALATFAIHFSDRYIMRSFSGLEAVGLYAVAYKFGMLISAMIGQPFSLIWGNRLHTYYWDPNRDALYNKTLSGLSFSLCGAAVFLSLFIDPILMLMTPKLYWPAAPLVPVLAAGYVLFVLNSISCAPLQCEARTGPIALISIAVAAVSIGLNLLLIPRLGAMGAALVTVLSFALMLGWTWQASMRVSPMRLEYDRAWKPMLAAALVASGGRALAVDELWIQLAVDVLWLLAYPALLLAMGFLRADEQQFLRSRLAERFMRPRRA